MCSPRRCTPAPTRSIAGSDEFAERSGARPVRLRVVGPRGPARAGTGSRREMTAAGADRVTRIVAVRHGETDWNAQMRMQGQLDTALSERGRWQASRVAQALAGEGIEAIFASDLARAFDTARAIAAVIDLPIDTDRGLRERGFGIFEGYTYAEIDARWPDEAARWRRHEPAFRPEGGESLIEFSARAVAAVTAIRTLARPDDPRRQPRRRPRLPVPGGRRPRSRGAAHVGARQRRDQSPPLHRRALHPGRLERHRVPRRRSARRRQRGRLPDGAEGGDMSGARSARAERS